MSTNTRETAWEKYPSATTCIGEGCPSNDHSNGDHDYTPDNRALLAELTQNGVSLSPTNMVPVEHWHKDGGYALSQKWI